MIPAKQIHRLLPNVPTALISMPQPSPLQRHQRTPGVPCVLLRLLSLIAGLLSPQTTLAEDFQGSTHKLSFDDSPLFYSTAEATDPVAKIAKNLRANRAASWKPFHPDFGYLPALLEMLNVPASSQMLVFSKTSVQRQNIDPSNPRALYFSDDVYIGYIPGAPQLEIAAVDPLLGTVFYTVNQDKDEPVRFRRSNDCLSCHASSRSMGIPGFVLRSIDTEISGEIIQATDADPIAHFTPMKERWGGWYVTNLPPDWLHRGNSPGGQDREGEAAKQRLASISTSPLYPASGSDPVALLLHDHQTHMHNYITRLHLEALKSIAEFGQVRYLDIPIRAFLRYLLFTEEAPLPSPLEPSPEFLGAFQKNAKRDSKGRSLKDFDLHTRIFRYPCSFLIDSDAFRSLPSPLRQTILERLHAILTGEDKHPDFANLSPTDCQTVLEILRDTAPDLTSGW